MVSLIKRSFILFSFGLFVLFFGCAKKQTIKPIEPQFPKTDEETNIRGKEFSSSPELMTVYFEYDQAELTEEARNKLQKNTDYLTKNPDREVLVEGYCDERGTIEYNLALGQKRASMVRDYYMMLGISGSRLATISYGEEKPACPGHTEDCWWRNRRADMKSRSIKVKPAKEPDLPAPAETSKPQELK